MFCECWWRRLRATKALYSRDEPPLWWSRNLMKYVVKLLLSLNISVLQISKSSTYEPSDRFQWHSSAQHHFLRRCGDGHDCLCIGPTCHMVPSSLKRGLLPRTQPLNPAMSAKPPSPSQRSALTLVAAFEQLGSTLFQVYIRIFASLPYQQIVISE